MSEDKPLRCESDAELRARVAAIIESFHAQRIHLSELPLETVRDGVSLRGRIYYWAKDWFVVLEAPIFAIGPGRHLLYMAPARYVAPGQEPGEGLHGVKLPGSEVLVEVYEAALADSQPPS